MALPEEFNVHYEFVDYDLRRTKRKAKEQTARRARHTDGPKDYFRESIGPGPEVRTLYNKALHGDEESRHILRKFGVTKWFRNGIGAII